MTAGVAMVFLSPLSNLLLCSATLVVICLGGHACLSGAACGVELIASSTKLSLSTKS